jgi:electron transfer flavoprotein beta subunit
MTSVNNALEINMAQKLEILVLLRETADPRPPARTLLTRAGIDDRGLRMFPNPGDFAALEEALCVADSQGANVTAVAIGGKRVEDMLRQALAMGATRAIRVDNHGIDGNDAIADANLLARIYSILSPSLIFTGKGLVDRGDDPAPALAAIKLGMPTVTAAVSLSMSGSSLEVVRKSDRGARQKVSAPVPCAIFFSSDKEPRYPSYDAVMDSMKAEVEKWNLIDLGLPLKEVNYRSAALLAADYSFPRLNPLRATTPDPNLIAFNRIISLLSGGVKAREGKMHTPGNADEAADALIKIFKAEGLLP